MSTDGETAKNPRVQTTRELVLTTAEQLFAEQGVYAVSHRQIGETAGQGNTAVVGYHFGSRADLVRAIIAKHMQQIDRFRAQRLADTDDSTGIRGWVDCIVQPVAENLAFLGTPTWFARFSAQVLTSPSLREIMIEEAFSAPSLTQARNGLEQCLPDLPSEVRAERGDMMHQLVTHAFAERERALAHNTPTPRNTWHDAASGLVDAIAGLWLAPSTPDR